MHAIEKILAELAGLKEVHTGGIKPLMKRKYEKQYFGCGEPYDRFVNRKSVPFRKLFVQRDREFINMI